jgi:ankyrin repeat protein
VRNSVLSLVCHLNYYRFRWVACQLDFICDLTSDDEYYKALDGPAPTLFEIYERLLLRLQGRPKSTQSLVKSALLWILFSEKPLNFGELCEAVAVRISNTGNEKKPNPASLNQIRKFCSSLIREAADGKRLEAAHFTVTEFFESITRESHPHIAHFCLSKEGAWLEFSKVCLTYLNFKVFLKPIPHFEDLEYALENHQFYEHAALWWISYAQEHWTDENVLRLAKQLFKCPMSTNFKLWRNCVIYRTDEGPELMERINTFGDSPLHWAAYFGIHQLLEWHLSSGQDVDDAGALGTPLLAAVSGSDLDLIQGSSHISVPPYSYIDILLLRDRLCEENVQNCVRTLVQRGTQTEHIYECEIGDETHILSLPEVLLYSKDIQVLKMESFAVEVFDERVAARMKSFINLAEKDNWDDIPLREGMVQMLRRMDKTCIAPEFRLAFDDYVKELEVDVETDYETMDDIWAAAKNDQADVLESLLRDEPYIKINERDDAGADSDFDEEEYYFDGKNALHYAASAGSFECIQVLMDAGANVHTTAKSGSTALQLAVESSSIGAKQCVEMLVDAGLSLYARNDKEWTLLHFAAHSGHPKTVEYLLQKGFDPHLAEDSGSTAYHLAASNGSGDVLKLLLEHEKGGISGIHVSNADGFKPAKLAVVEDNSGFIWELLKHVDIEELAIEEEPFLLFVAGEGSAMMIEVILNSNPDIFVRGSNQSTILHALAENESNVSKFINDVIKIGVTRSDARNDGSMPLHLLLSGQQPVKKELLDMLIEGNPNDVDGKGNNYLMCLSHSQRPASEKKDIALHLIKLGVNAFQKNINGEFFYYQFAKTNPDSGLALIKLGVDALEKNNEGECLD